MTDLWGVSRAKSLNERAARDMRRADAKRPGLDRLNLMHSELTMHLGHSTENMSPGGSGREFPNLMGPKSSGGRGLGASQWRQGRVLERPLEDRSAQTDKRAEKMAKMAEKAENVGFDLGFPDPSLGRRAKEYADYVRMFVARRSEDGPWRDERALKGSESKAIEICRMREDGPVEEINLVTEDEDLERVGDVAGKGRNAKVRGRGFVEECLEMSISKELKGVTATALFLFVNFLVVFGCFKRF